MDVPVRMTLLAMKLGGAFEEEWLDPLDRKLRCRRSDRMATKANRMLDASKSTCVEDNAFVVVVVVVVGGAEVGVGAWDPLRGVDAWDLFGATDGLGTTGEAALPIAIHASNSSEQMPTMRLSNSATQTVSSTPGIRARPSSVKPLTKCHKTHARCIDRLGPRVREAKNINTKRKTGTEHKDGRTDGQTEGGSVATRPAGIHPYIQTHIHLRQVGRTNLGRDLW